MQGIVDAFNEIFRKELTFTWLKVLDICAARRVAPE